MKDLRLTIAGVELELTGVDFFAPIEPAEPVEPKPIGTYEGEFEWKLDPNVAKEWREHHDAQVARGAWLATENGMWWVFDARSILDVALHEKALGAEHIGIMILPCETIWEWPPPKARSEG